MCLHFRGDEGSISTRSEKKSIGFLAREDTGKKRNGRVARREKKDLGSPELVERKKDAGPQRLAAREDNMPSHRHGEREATLIKLE